MSAGTSVRVQLTLNTKADQEVDLHVPKPGTVRWTCGMGMYSGTVEVLP